MNPRTTTGISFWTALQPAGAVILASSIIFWSGGTAVADCTLTNLNITPLPDLGYGMYQGFTGGLYPGGSNQRPSAHEEAGLRLAEEEVAPRDADGNVETNSGKIVLLSIGMSNTTQEFSEFKSRANSDPSRNPQLIIIDGAQGGQEGTRWTNANAQAWTNVMTCLTTAGVTTNQVQVLWIKQALASPNNYGAFPAHARALQEMVEICLRLAQQRFPNLKLAYLSSRTRAYVMGPAGLNPEPFAFEGAFAMKWLIEKQIAGNLNFDPSRGPVAAPWLSWGPYLWADGTQPRSDGFTWLCSDLSTDFTHPSTTGRIKVAQQLLAFFKTDPTSRPWFLRHGLRGQPPICAPAADVISGPVPQTVRLTANASDPDGSVTEHFWTFEDGTFATNANPIKRFPAPGIYHARLTVTDNSNNTASAAVTVTVTTTYEQWRQARFTSTELADPDISGEEADPDHDGIVNKMEYACGLDPKSADPSGAATLRSTVVNDRLLLTFARSRVASDVAFILELSEDLATWEPATPLLELVATETSGLGETVTYRLNQSATGTARAFVRLKVVHLP